jgi:hypothetical protein
MFEILFFLAVFPILFLVMGAASIIGIIPFCIPELIADFRRSKIREQKIQALLDSVRD